MKKGLFAFHFSKPLKFVLDLPKCSLCHRPRNCNLSNLCGRCKSLAPEIVSWYSASRNLLRLRRKARCARLSPPADSRAFGARARASRFALDFPRASGARIWVNCLESSLWQRLPKWEFSTGKKHFSSGKNREKWLCPLRKKILLRLCFLVVFVCFLFICLFLFLFCFVFCFCLFVCFLCQNCP